MRELVLLIFIFFCGLEVFSQTISLDLKKDSLDEIEFGRLEARGDSCLKIKDKDCSKEFYLSALKIKDVCRVQAKFSELTGGCTLCNGIPYVLDIIKKSEAEIKSGLIEKADSNCNYAEAVLKGIYYAREHDIYFHKTLLEILIMKVNILTRKSTPCVRLSWEEFGDREFKEKEYLLAKKSYEKALEGRPGNLDIKRKIAECDKFIQLNHKKKK